jgi:hypothetical protein
MINDPSRTVVRRDDLKMTVTLGNGETINQEEYQQRMDTQDRANLAYNDQLVLLARGAYGPVDIPIVMGCSD